jgi:TatD DNase family protein
MEHLDALQKSLSGMAVMSTHPRDFVPVLGMAEEKSLTIQPCLGVHPWFLNEIGEEDWSCDDSGLPKWVASLGALLLAYPQVVVGEIGLDGFHFDPVTKDLTTSMKKQVAAFRFQLDLATKHQRPVSIHCVRAVGKMMDTIQEVYRENNRLPPKLYFHAFGGKASTATQIIKTLEKSKQKKNQSTPPVTPTTCYFGFAPIINFQSPKTMEVIRTVGLERLVLETDHEDVRNVPSSMALGIKEISKALDVTEEILIRKTNENVRDLYGLSQQQKLDCS